MSESSEAVLQAIPQPGLTPPAFDVTELLLIRHGRSADVVPGSPESADPPLHAEGEQQAARLAERLAGKELDAVYASHLRRAVRTAEAFAVPKGLEVHIDPELEEVRLGDWSNGEFRRRAYVRDPEWVAWSRTRTWDGIPGAEGDAVFRNRVTLAIDRAVAAHPGGRIAVVCHGGVIGAYLAVLLGSPRTIWMTCDNTSISVVHHTPEGHSIVTVNDCRHLDDPALRA
jgi:2,3-bisphosphoglycerate-dependent phosphoglycerate mutase